MLGCTATSFGVLYKCRICVVMVSYLSYHVIICQKLLVSLNCIVLVSVPVPVLFAVNIFEHCFTSASHSYDRVNHILVSISQIIKMWLMP